MAPATQAVFETPELLEAILHQLPTKDLLFAQKVCKHWKVVIEGSPKLQRALFFRPVEIDLLLPYMKVSGWEWLTDDEKRYTVFANPLLSPVFEIIDQSMVGDLKYGCNHPSSTLPSAWHCSEASWKRMLPTQPAIKLEWIPNSHPVHFSTGYLYDTKVDRIGTILGAIDEFRACHPYICRFDEVSGIGEWEPLSSNEQLENMREFEEPDETEDEDDELSDEDEGSGTI